MKKRKKKRRKRKREMSHTGFTFKVHRCTDIDAYKYEVMPSSPTTETIVEVIFLNTSRLSLEVKGY